MIDSTNKKKNMHRKLFLLLALASCTGTFAQKVLKTGTLIPVTITEKVTSKSNSANIIVAQDIKVEGVTAIAAGTPVVNQVTSVKRRGCGRPGSVTVNILSTTDINGETVRLMGQPLTKEGASKKGKAIGLGVGLGVFMWPCLACLAIKGGEAEIPAGTIVQNMMTNNEVVIK
ncbi:MAG TPA: hypothetical protein DDW22_03675 [Prevotellaceae bacterium]|nr:hypothetical protein [Prevotellaceae bacterium]